MKRFTDIPGMFTPRLPRAGKIHLGVTKESAKGNEYPVQTDYFVCPEEVEAVFGKEPKTLPIVLPVDSFENVCPVSFKKYGTSGVVCRGDGQEFERWVYDEKTKEQVESEGECPTPDDCDFAKDAQGKTVCRREANLHVMIPEVSDGGTYQIDTSSFWTISSLRDCIFMARATRGSASMQMLLMRRVEKVTQSGPFKGKKNWPIQFIIPNRDLEQKLLKKFPRTAEFLSRFHQARHVIAGVPTQPGLLEVASDLQPREVVTEVLRTGGSTGDPSVDRMFRDDPCPDTGTDQGAAPLGPCRGCGVECDLVNTDKETGEVWGLCGPCDTKAHEVAEDAEAVRLNALQKEKKPRKPRQKKAEAVPATAVPATAAPVSGQAGAVMPMAIEEARKAAGLDEEPKTPPPPPQGGVDAMEGL